MMFDKCVHNTIVKNSHSKDFPGTSTGLGGISEVNMDKLVLAIQVYWILLNGSVFRMVMGLTLRNDTKEDAFVHQTVIKRNNSRKFLCSIADEEIVEFYIKKV